MNSPEDCLSCELLENERSAYWHSFFSIKVKRYGLHGNKNLYQLLPITLAYSINPSLSIRIYV